MTVVGGYPFWAIKNGLGPTYPPLERDLRVDVLVIGAGISGALIATELALHGHRVAIVEQGEIGWGSTAASTALVQYEIDTHATELAKRYGRDVAALAYRSCATAVAKFETIAKRFSGVDVATTESLYYASSEGDEASVREEFAFRAKLELPVEWLSRSAIRERFSFDAPAAILSHLGVRVDPYALTLRMIAALAEGGCGVFDRVRVSGIEPSTDEVAVRTEAGPTVIAKHVVMAGGYAAQTWLPASVARNRATYALVTDPIDRAILGPLASTMIWESARPYLYLRATGDSRLVIGGEDDRVDLAPLRDHLIARRAGQLIARVSKQFPHLPLVRAFAWGGTFAETDDGLPYFGTHERYGRRVQFALAYGGNGITFSTIGAEIVRAAVEEREHPMARICAFDRKL